MTNLIKIELKKFSIKSHLIHLAIANFIMLGLLTPILLFAGADEASVDVVSLISTLNLATFIVWQGVLIAKIIVEEFRSKTIFLLFTYPISRKKLIVSKLVVVNTTIFLSMLATLTLQNTYFTILARFAPQLEYSLTIGEIGLIATLSIASIMMGMLSLFVGMINKSTIATIVSSLIVVAIMGTSVGEAGGLITSAAITLGVGAVGIILAYMSVRNIDKKDLLV